MPTKGTVPAHLKPWQKLVKETQKKWPSMPFSEILKVSSKQYRGKK